VLTFSLTFDHRALDGATAARFLQALAAAIAHPTSL
jgi:pyruvate/2-oxoglutarate dehydrogenase complex dihydrolipoamide acyltransferase (E2) component